MAVLFAPQYRDPNAELKKYMLQFAQIMGDKRTAGKESAKIKSFAESISPPDISTINDQRLFSPDGQEAMQAALFEGGPAAFGQRPGQQTLSSQQILQKALTADVPIQKALQLAQTLGRPTGSGYTLSPGQTRYGPGGQEIASGAPKLTESQQLQAEGYTSEEIRRIRDIKHGIEPRAASRITYDRMTAVEKMKYLSSERIKAEGQYFGMILSGETPEPARQPEYLAWILTEQEKYQQELGGTGTTDELPSPKNQAEYDAINPGTEFIDTDGKKKVKR